MEQNPLFLLRHGATAVGEQMGAPPKWQPAVDVYRCAHGWLIKFELAGVRREDIQLEVHGRGVTISGVRRDVRHFEWQEAHLMEIAYSNFERSVQLPEPVEHMQLTLEFRDGMLYVRAFATDAHKE